MRICTCQNGADCNPVDGSCMCQAGWMGKECFFYFLLSLQQSPGQECTMSCARGTYGVNCTAKCDCGQSALCDPIDGECICPPGFTGTQCDKGYYLLLRCSSRELPLQYAPTTRSAPVVVASASARTMARVIRSVAHALVHQDGMDDIGEICTSHCVHIFIQSSSERPCPSGFYGIDCEEKCQCSSHVLSGKIVGKVTKNVLIFTEELTNEIDAPLILSRCDHVTGACTCAAGFTGVDCRTPCPPDRWGAGCAHKLFQRHITK